MLDFGRYFDNSRFMESKSAVTALGALAQESCLGVYRLLVQAGTEGMAAKKKASRKPFGGMKPPPKPWPKPAKKARKKAAKKA